MREGGKEAGREEGEYMMGFDNSEYEPILTHTSTHTHTHRHKHTQHTTRTHIRTCTHTHLRTEKTIAILPTALTRQVTHITLIPSFHPLDAPVNEEIITYILLENTQSTHSYSL